LTAGYKGLRPQIAERNQRDLADFNALCKVWNVVPLPASVNDAVQSDVPALVLSGRFDPITPPGNGQRVAEALSNVYSFVFPNTGHGAFRSEPCANAIVAAFLDDPATKPGDSCIARLKPPAFITPGSIVSVTSLIRLTSLTQQGRVELAVFGLSLFVLLSAFALIPLGWLLRLLLNRNTVPLPRMARLNPWLTLMNGAVLAGFLGSLGAAVFQLVNANNLSFLLGLPPDTRGLFVLPIIAVVLTALMIAGVIVGWRRWGWLRRLYRALLAAASVACIGVLIAWGMLLAPLIG
jgi:hypothetical protein